MSIIPEHSIIISTGGLNCANFIAGIVEAILFGCNFVSMKTGTESCEGRFCQRVTCTC